MSHTKGPWYLVAEDGVDFTVIATEPKIDGNIDSDKEVLGTSEWIRATKEDLTLMAAAPELLEKLNMALGFIEGEKIRADKEFIDILKITIAKAEGIDLEECERCSEVKELHEDSLCEECYYHFHCECGIRLEDGAGSPGDGLCRKCD